MTIKIKIYGPDWNAAAKLAATMNLALRQWHYAGAEGRYEGWVWADVEPLFERIEELEGRLAR